MKSTSTFLFSAVFIALISITSFSGCDKNDTLPQTCSNGIKDADETGVDCGGSCNDCTTEAFRIKTYSHTAFSTSSSGYTTETYAYDNKGRVSTITYTGFFTGVSTYTYGNGNVTLVDRDNFTSVYTLNSLGYATSVTWVGGPTYNFLYDSEWQLLDDGTGIYSWTANNITFVRPELSGFTFLTDKVNTVGNVNKGISFLGKDSKNLPESKQYGTGGKYFYTYEYDSQNRVTKAIEVGNTVWEPFVYTYF